MSWESFGTAFLACFLAVFFGVALFEWIRAERDERRWRRTLENEMARYKDKPVTYRLVADTPLEDEL